MSISAYKRAVVESTPTDTGAIHGVAVVIATSDLEQTKRCLDSIQNQTVKLLTVVVAADTQTQTYIRAEMQRHKDLRKIRCTEPLTTTEAWNCGLQWAWDSGFTEALVVNGDQELKPNTYETMKDHIKTYELIMPPSKDAKLFMMSRSAWRVLGPFV